MALDNIEKLLEQYFEGTTSIEEENILKDYFAQDSVAAHLEQYKPMFVFFAEAKKERFTRQVPLKSKTRLYQWISVAAVALLSFSLYFGNEYREQKEAEFAYQETKKAFELLAENFGRGTEKVAYLKEFENAKQKIYNNN